MSLFTFYFIFYFIIIFLFFYFTTSVFQCMYDVSVIVAAKEANKDIYYKSLIVRSNCLLGLHQHNSDCCLLSKIAAFPLPSKSRPVKCLTRIT